MAAALAVVQHAPRAARPYLENVAFSAFHSGVWVACLAGAVVAAVGAVLAYVLLPGRAAVATGVVPEQSSAVDAVESLGVGEPRQETGEDERCGSGSALAPV